MGFGVTHLQNNMLRCVPSTLRKVGETTVLPFYISLIDSHSICSFTPVKRVCSVASRKFYSVVKLVYSSFCLRYLRSSVWSKFEPESTCKKMYST
jgi:hypothetical protein